MSSASSVSTRMCDTARLRNHFLSAGTMNQGASGVLQRVSASSYAVMYWSQCFRSSKSPGDSFHCFVGSRSRSSKRRHCSSLLICRKNLATTTPLLVRSRSRSEEHTSELQSLAYLVCRLLLEKKKKECTHVLRSTTSR